MDAPPNDGFTQQFAGDHEHRADHGVVVRRSHRLLAVLYGGQIRVCLRYCCHGFLPVYASFTPTWQHGSGMRCQTGYTSAYSGWASQSMTEALAVLTRTPQIVRMIMIDIRNADQSPGCWS